MRSSSGGGSGGGGWRGGAAGTEADRRLVHQAERQRPAADV